MLDGDDSTPGSALHLAHLFDKAKKTGQKEILRWYCYSEKFEKKVTDISFKNELNDQMARTQIYNEMEPFLPGIKREYLRKKTQKARNIYTLFKEIGIDKIKQVTYSADAISSLTGVQIQNIIKLFSEKPNVELVNEQAECQKVIGVKNLHAQTTKRSCSNDISVTKVNLSPIDLKLKASEETKKVLPETGINVLPSDTKTNVIASQPQAKPPVSRPPISILPDDPKEKRNHVIKMVLEKVPNLSLNYSNKNVDYFTCLTSCRICNKVHKEENLEGEWGGGEYVNTRTYRLRCWGNKYQNSIQIVTVKA